MENNSEDTAAARNFVVKLSNEGVQKLKSTQNGDEASALLSGKPIFKKTSDTTYEAVILQKYAGLINITEAKANISFLDETTVKVTVKQGSLYLLLVSLAAVICGASAFIFPTMRDVFIHPLGAVFGILAGCFSAAAFYFRPNKLHDMNRLQKFVQAHLGGEWERLQK